MPTTHPAAPAAATLQDVTIEGVDDLVTVPAYVDPSRRWNGFVSPYLPAESVDMLAANMDPAGADVTIVRDGDVVTITDTTWGDDDSTYTADPHTMADGTTAYLFDFAWTFTVPGDAR
jgi:hypothetical protein